MFLSDQNVMLKCFENYLTPRCFGYNLHEANESFSHQIETSMAIKCHLPILSFFLSKSEMLSQIYDATNESFITPKLKTYVRIMFNK